MADIPMLNPGRDGDAHLTVYVDDVSVVWAGDGRIYLCPGGYGEPVAASYKEPWGFSRMPLEDARRELERIADLYIAAMRIGVEST